MIVKHAATRIGLAISMAAIGLTSPVVSSLQAQATKAATALQSTSAQASATLGSFLEVYPIGVSESSAKKQELWQRFGAGIIAWRVVEDAEAKKTLADGRAGFAAECAGLKGKVSAADKRAVMSITKIEGRETAWAGIANPDICMGTDGKAVAALYAYAFTHRAFFKNAVNDRTAFFLISKDAIDANIRHTLEQWHFRLRQGDETNCGYVLELKGTLVQVAKGERVLWMRRDQLRPAGQGECRQKTE